MSMREIFYFITTIVIILQLAIIVIACFRNFTHNKIQNFHLKYYYKNQEQLEQPNQHHHYNNSNLNLNRHKRFLIFNGGGIIKLVFGFSEPIEFSMRNPFRQLSVIYNFQIQYMPPARPFSVTAANDNFFWFGDDVNGDSKMMRMKTKRKIVSQKFKHRKITHDSSREYIYSLIENAFDYHGSNGKQCLLKILCEVGQSSIHGNTMIHEILRTIFTPIVENIHGGYLDARKAGLYGADCTEIYHECKTRSFIEKFSVYF